MNRRVRSGIGIAVCAALPSVWSGAALAQVQPMENVPPRADTPTPFHENDMPLTPERKRASDLDAPPERSAPAGEKGEQGQGEVKEKANNIDDLNSMPAPDKSPSELENP